MGIVVFVIVLVALILVHEFGHFVAAKLFGMRVDEFGIGYPPKAIGWKRGETEYTLNWLPFGGFVKIYGEDESVGNPALATNSRSFVAKPHLVQAIVLVAGIAMNLVFAYILLSVTLAVGMPRALEAEEVALAPDAMLVVSNVVPDSPADDAGIQAGDSILAIARDDASFSGASTEDFSAFVSSSDETLTITLDRSGTEITTTATPEGGIITSDPSRKALGVNVGAVGTVPVSVLEAPIEGAVLTWEITKQTAIGLTAFFGSIFTLSADLAQVSGPVGIAGAVGTASETGLVSLLTLTAIISINLALINLLPIPALDGGRLLFVVIESIIRRPIPMGVSGFLNAAGFAFLILLMFAVTANDIWKLVA